MKEIINESLMLPSADNLFSRYVQSEEFHYFDVSMQRAWKEAVQRWPLLKEMGDRTTKGA